MYNGLGSSYDKLIIRHHRKKQHSTPHAQLEINTQ